MSRWTVRSTGSRTAPDEQLVEMTKRSPAARGRSSRIWRWPGASTASQRGGVPEAAALAVRRSGRFQPSPQRVQRPGYTGGPAARRPACRGTAGSSPAARPARDHRAHVLLQGQVRTEDHPAQAFPPGQHAVDQSEVGDGAQLRHHRHERRRDACRSSRNSAPRSSVGVRSADCSHSRTNSSPPSISGWTMLRTRSSRDEKW